MRRIGRNRLYKTKRSFLGRQSPWIIALILAFFFASMLYLFLMNQCSRLSGAIARAEVEKKKCQDKLGSARTHWNTLQSRKNLDATIAYHGLEMALVRPDQVIRMLPDGRPAPGQISVARAQARKSGAERVAGMLNVMPAATRRGGAVRRR